MKHTEVTTDFDWNSLTKGDKLVFASIKRYMNKDTRSCFPAIRTVAKKLKCSDTKVQNAIYRLENAGLIKIKREEGKSNSYWFPPETDKFEMFTDEFLDMDLNIKVKEYYMDIQPYLYGKESGVGKTTYSNTKLAELTGLSIPTIKKYNTILIEKNLLCEEVTDKRDTAGLPIVQKSFDLNGLQQAALWVKAVTEQVTTNTADIEDLKMSNEEMKSEIEKLTKKIAVLERAQSIERNKTSNITEFEM